MKASNLIKGKTSFHLLWLQPGKLLQGRGCGQPHLSCSLPPPPYIYNLEPLQDNMKQAKGGELVKGCRRINF